MSGTILVVDDDVDSVGWVTEALRGAGYDAVAATNGAEALRSIHAMERPPCVVILDLAMPVMSGWDVIATLVRSPARPKIIVMSAYCKDDGVPAGAVALLRKPVLHDALIDTVRHWCGAPAMEPDRSARGA